MPEGTADPAGRLDGVGETAVAVARIRAQESLRADRLFADPVAAGFVTGVGESVERDLLTMSPAARDAVISMYYSVIGRTRFLDDVCAAGLAQGVDQVVIIGAGLDTRGFRLGWPPNVSLFEVDRADVFAVKEPVVETAGIQATCRRSPVVADLRDAWTVPLTDAGFDKRRPTVWLAEGLLVYLDPDVVTGVLAAITEASASGSHAGITTRTRAPFTQLDPANDPYAGYHTLWRSFGAVDVAEWLGANGWHITETVPRDVVLACGRTDPALPAEVDQPLLIHGRRAG